MGYITTLRTYGHQKFTFAIAHTREPWHVLSMLFLLLGRVLVKVFFLLFIDKTLSYIV